MDFKLKIENLKRLKSVDERNNKTKKINKVELIKKCPNDKRLVILTVLNKGRLKPFCTSKRGWSVNFDRDEVCGVGETKIA